jgi:hypothetical protein
MQGEGIFWERYTYIDLTWIHHLGATQIVTRKLLTCTHFQSGLTALRMAQSEGGHQDVCDLLLRYTQGPNVQQIKRGSEGEGETNRQQQQDTNTELTEVRSMHSYMTTLTGAFS